VEVAASAKHASGLNAHAPDDAPPALAGEARSPGEAIVPPSTPYPEPAPEPARSLPRAQEDSSHSPAHAVATTRVPSAAEAPAATTTAAAAAPAASSTSPSSPSTAPGPSETDIYSGAHRLHFEGGDVALALAAWDDYLARYPHGRFVPEARYNRAIDLLKLKRYPEARAALQPFAGGAFGGYHRDDASELLRSIP
jgi:hypothetical protein